MRHAIAFALALFVTLPLPSCGACLIVERQPCELKLLGGGSVSVEVHRRLHGLAESEHYEPELTLYYLLSLVTFDWIDTAAAPLVAIRCMFDPSQSIEGGPIGFLAALTPGASLSPGMKVSLRELEGVDSRKVEHLRDATGEERAQLLLDLFGDTNVRDVTFR